MTRLRPLSDQTGLVTRVDQTRLDLCLTSCCPGQTRPRLTLHTTVTLHRTTLDHTGPHRTIHRDVHLIPLPDHTCGDTGPDQDQTRPDQTRPDQTRPHRTRPDQTRPDQTRPDQTRPDQTRPDQTRPDQTRPEILE